MKIITCHICNCKFVDYFNLSVHIRFDHHLKVKEYYDNHLKTVGEDICRRCGKINKFVDLRSGYRKYCSVRCSNKSDEKIEKVKSYNYKNTKAKWKNPKTRNKIIRAMKQAKLNPEYRKRVSNDVKNRWKNKPEIFNNLKESNRKRLLNGGAAYLNSFIKNPSKPQLELFNIIKEIYPTAIMNYQILNYSVDIAIPQIKLAIEYDGSYWHPDKEKDDLRQNKIMCEGWRFLRYKDRVPTKDEIIKDMNKYLFKGEL